jgi:hypothetical protein
MGKYNYNLLHEFCMENDIKLLADYSKLTLEYSTKIILECKQCGLETEKCFAYMIKTKCSFCKICITKNSLSKQKETMLKKYGVEHASQSVEIKIKIKKGFIEKYGVDNPSKTIAVKNKMKQTNLKRYGVEYLVHNAEIKKKMINTNLKKYGVENPLSNKSIRTKINTTILEKYGVENVAQNIDIQTKMKETTFKNHGVEYPLQSFAIKEKTIKTNLEKYGVENPTQNAEISNKQLLSGYNIKEYILPSGNVLNYQGFENFAIDDLLNDNYLENDIITCRTKVPNIYYFDSNNKKRRHFVDIFVPSKNLCIEVKSEYTITVNYEKIIQKQNAGKILGYNYEIWVYNRKGKILDIQK